MNKDIMRYMIHAFLISQYGKCQEAQQGLDRKFFFTKKQMLEGIMSAYAGGQKVDVNIIDSLGVVFEEAFYESVSICRNFSEPTILNGEMHYHLSEAWGIFFERISKHKKQ